MKKNLVTIIGSSVALLGIVAVTGVSIASAARARITINAENSWESMSTGDRVRWCLQERRDAGYFNHGDERLSSEERRAIRLRLRQCIRAAVTGGSYNGSSSSYSSGMSSSHSSMSSSSMSGMSSSMSSNPSSGSSSSASSVSSGMSSSHSSMSSMSSVSSGMSSSHSSMSSMSSASSVAVSRTVSIDDFDYRPGTVVVREGQTVRWTNNDTAPHTVTRDGATGPNSTVLQPGQSYTYTFTTEGTYNYHCTLHPEMEGRVIVLD